MHGPDAMSAQPPVQPVGPAPESPPMAHAGARAVAPWRVANVEAVARSRRLTMAADGPLLRLLGGVVDKCIAQADGRGAWHGSRSAGEGRGDGALQFRIVQHRVALPIGSSLNRAARAHHFNAMPSTTNEMQQWAASRKRVHSIGQQRHRHSAKAAGQFGAEHGSIDDQGGPQRAAVARVLAGWWGGTPAAPRTR